MLPAHWPASLTTSATPDVGIPGTGSYGTAADPVPVALPGGFGGPLPSLPSLGDYIQTEAWTFAIMALAVLLIVAATYVLLNG